MDEYKDISKLKQEVENLESDSLAYIRFYENNINSIEKIDITKNESHYNAKLRLLSEYGLNLIAAGYFKKGASVLKQAIMMFENNPYQDFENFNKSSYFEHLLWNYGIALWETNQIEQSTKIFNRLVEYYPDNEKYAKWLTGLKTYKLKKYTKPLYIAIGLWLLCDITVFEKINPKIKLWATITATILIVITASLEIYIYVTQKRTK